MGYNIYYIILVEKLARENLVQESLLNTVKKLQAQQKKQQKINVVDLEDILDSDLDEVVSLCKKACLKPKTDEIGNAYFTSSDVDVLKKMKELYEQAQALQKSEKIVQESTIENADEQDLTSAQNKINFLTKAKNAARGPVSAISSVQNNFNASLARLENNLIDKIGDMLSEKMDGFDEIIVELIRAKTENENLRNQVNDLNKQMFVLKKELASFAPLPFGFYTKKESEEL